MGAKPTFSRLGPAIDPGYVELLEAAHYQTIAAEGFAPAVQLLESAQPDLLVTAVRLGAFNGLHLVIRGHARSPRMAALVVDDVRDPVLERESRRLGVTAYLVRPVDVGALTLPRCGRAGRLSRPKRFREQTPLAPTGRLVTDTCHFAGMSRGEASHS